MLKRAFRERQNGTYGVEMAKACLVDMEQNGNFDIDAELHKFCVSKFTLQVAHAGTLLTVKSWNEHAIPRK